MVRAGRAVAWVATGVLGACGPADEDDTRTRDCSASELAPPLCHRAVVVGATAEITGYRLVIVDALRDGVRPVLTVEPSPSRLTLSDPFDVHRVFVEVPLPLADIGILSATSFGDLDGDGVHDIAAWMRGAQPTWTIVVLDARSLETMAIRETDFEGNAFSANALDVDGDGANELVTVGRVDAQVTVGIWRLDGGELVDIATTDVAVDCLPLDLHGDFDGDGNPDLAVAWDEPCTSPSLLVLRGGANDPTAPVFDELPHPMPLSGVAAADVDADDDDEIVVFHSSSTMTVVDWRDGAAPELAQLTLPGDFEAHDEYVRVRVGQEAGQPDWLIVSGLRNPGAPPSEAFDAAVFFDHEDLVVVPIESEPFLVADYDDDGLSDFSVWPEGVVVAYRSLP